MFPQPTSNHRSMSMSPRCRPRQAKSLWTNSWPRARRTRPRPRCRPSQAPPAKRFRTEPLAASSSLRAEAWGQTSTPPPRPPSVPATSLPPLREAQQDRARGPYTARSPRGEDLASPPETQDTGAKTWAEKNSRRTFVFSVLERRKEEDFLQDRVGNFHAATSTPTPPPETSVLRHRGANASTNPRTSRDCAQAAACDPQDHRLPQAGGQHGDARKALFEELLWEHGILRGAHKCQAIPEASIEALKAQVAALQGRAEEAAKALKGAGAAHKAAAEEATRAGKQPRAGRAVEGGMRLFPDSQAHAMKKVAEHRAQQAAKFGCTLGSL
ncbi:hypothetical protein QYE76_020864 [Lolium multiflorum]|uniref:Uncharacterized protein n=1 Tax=Lolium multiflorum TaxID=4521 RepID=A0AAD8VPN3_LOLMU|nr:hypothetical protein QYE76_020864 [Lolium multiflorum]